MIHCDDIALVISVFALALAIFNFVFFTLRRK